MPLRFWDGQGPSSEGWEVDQARLAIDLAVTPCNGPDAEPTLWIPRSLTHHG